MLMGIASAADYRASAENYRDYLHRLQPGDRLLLEPGDYSRGLPLHNLSGRAGQPIIIEAANPLAFPRFIARAGANTVSLVDVRYLVLRHLEIDGRNLPVDAIKAEGHGRFADFIMLENLYIHDHAASQQNVGISTKCSVFGWVVKGNRIERVGTGMYFGDSDGSDPFVGGLIEANHVSHTLGYSLQIKHQKKRLTEMTGPHDTVIRYNVFSKQRTLHGSQSRPNVLLGHFPLTGPGSQDRYLVHNNLFLHNPSEALLQAEGRIAVYNNVFINGSGDAIHIQPHNDVPRDVAIFSNTVLAAGTGIQVRRAPGSSYRQRVIANVVAANMPVRGGEAAHNITLPYQPDLLSAALQELLPQLLARSQSPSVQRPKIIRELATYPDWQDIFSPDARIAPALLRTLAAVKQ